MTTVYVLLGGMIGVLSRYSLGKLFPFTLLEIQFSTLIVNFLGCGIAGVALHYLQSDSQKAFWIIGLCGALTTFSAYIIEMAQLIDQKSFLTLFTLWILHHSLCFLSFYFCYKKLPLMLG